MPHRSCGWTLVVSVVTLVACSDPPALPDAGLDATTRDAGETHTDAGETDAAIGDAGRGDSGAEDAGPTCTPLERGPEATHERLRTAWVNARPGFETALRAALDAGDTTGLYSVQIATDPLLMAAEAHRDLATLEELAAVYAIALDYLETQDEAVFYYVPAPVGSGARSEVLPLPRPARMWIGRPSDLPIGVETVLDVAQFLANVARLVRIAADVGEARAPALAAFARAFVPVLAEDTYARWIAHPSGFAGRFQRRGWGCNAGSYGLAESVEHLIVRAYGTDALPSPASSPVSYCNAVTDTELWILVGALELVAANRRDPALVPLDPDVDALLTSVAQRGAVLVASRMSTTSVLDRAGAEVAGLVFEAGAFDDHPDHRYAGDSDPSYPGFTVAGGAPARPPTPAVGTGWDLSHARRLVHVIDGFRRFSADVGADFDGAAIAGGLARQLAFGASIGDCDEVRFTNYFDGHNGWYRVNYSDRVGFGYAPFAMTDAVTSSGYGLWSDACPELGELVRCVFARTDEFDETTPAGARQVVVQLPSVLPYGVLEDHCGW